MHSQFTSRRLAPIAAAVVALSLAALAAAPQAGAATIYACVNKRTGAVRVFTRIPVCRRHETRVSWNTQGLAGKPGATGKTGPAGKNGANGKNGENGKNGAVSGYAATQPEPLPITTGLVSVVNKNLPAGHYLVSAKATVSVIAKGAGAVQASCKLSLATSTGESHLDSATWISPVVGFGGSEYFAASSLPLAAAVNLPAPGTLSVECETVQTNANEAVVSASNGQLVAVQTTSNS